MDADNSHPMARMPDAERKRVTERITLEWAYRTADFVRIADRERPDFALWNSTEERPFGVEITHLWPNQSQARLHMLPGYMDALWKGGRHRHRDDVEALKVSTFTVHDADGNLKHENLPGILTRPSTRGEFWNALADTIEKKSGLNYDQSEFSHINLAIYDWFDIPRNLTQLATSDLIDKRVAEALRTTPFREVVLLTYDSTSEEADELDDDDPDRSSPAPVLKRIGLRQRYILDRFYCTCHAIAEHLNTTCPDIDGAEASALLNRLTCDFVTRRLGLGTAVIARGTPHVLFGPVAIGLTTGIEVLDFVEFLTPDFEAATITDRLPPEIEDDILIRVGDGTLRAGSVENAHESETAAGMRDPRDTA
ncbi:hypothetical protein GS433_17965 [Rhodococcus hoagii]|nr:hypothetical protein [Prescottella equi]